MNTPAHLIFGAAAFGRAGQPAVTGAALLGALAPDLSLYLLVSWAMFVLGIEARVIFDEMYFSAPWQSVFAVDNSVPLWAFGLGMALWRRWPVGVAFAGAGLLHLAFDLPLHHDDARMHFWPLSDWVFRSPLSYWDPARHGRIVGVVEIAACLALCGLLWRRYRSWPGRGLIVVAALLEAAPGIMFAMMFARQ